MKPKYKQRWIIETLYKDHIGEIITEDHIINGSIDDYSMIYTKSLKKLTSKDDAQVGQQFGWYKGRFESNSPNFLPNTKYKFVYLSNQDGIQE